MSSRTIPNQNGTDKAYEPITALRERARAAYQAQLESEAAERADVFARGRRNCTARLVTACAELFYLDIDPDMVVTEVIPARISEPARIRARVVVDSIELSWSWSERNPPSLRLLTLEARVLCPCCQTPLTATARVSRIAQIGALMGEIGCACGWSPEREEGER